MKPKVGVISAVPNAEERYGRTALCREFKMFFRVGYLDKALELTLALQEDEHLDAIITIGIPMVIYDGASTAPIYPIYPDSYDILRSLHDSHSFGEKLAFAEMPLETIRYDFDQIVNILGYDVRHYAFHTDISFSHRENIEQLVRRIIADGRDAMSTMGGYSHEYACGLDFPSILVTPGEHSFQSTLENIIRNQFMYRVEYEKRRWVNAAFNNFKESVLVLDTEQRVVVLNTAAQQLMRLDQGTVVGRRIDDLQSEVPLLRKFLGTQSNFEVVKDDSKEYIIQKKVLYDGAEPLGTAISASHAKDLQRMELDARRKIYESGFVAPHTFDDIKGSDPAFAAVKQTAEYYAKTKSNIILYGESGCGKEMFAQGIHNAGSCAEGPFVAVNCTAFTETLLESELFGYQEGAFTGARKGGSPGLFEMSHKGTLFLDEIGDMPVSIQVKLLRVLQERTVRRIGGEKNIPIDVRFIFATNRDLRREIQNETFRKDLYYRINVLSLQIPPLREHKSDIKEISQSIIRQLSAQSGKTASLTDELLRPLFNYHWPGNIRELSNFWERAILLKTIDARTIRATLDELAPDEGSDAARNVSIFEGDTLTVGLDTMHNMENAIIHALYEKYGGSRKRISDALDISSSSLYRRLRDMNLLKRD